MYDTLPFEFFRALSFFFLARRIATTRRVILACQVESVVGVPSVPIPCGSRTYVHEQHILYRVYLNISVFFVSIFVESSSISTL